MKVEFRIHRTSTWYDRPCKEAILKQFILVDTRPVKTLKEAQGKEWAKEFFANGTNHREENGMIARDLGLRDVWTISFDNLEDLLKFNEKYGDIILGFTDSYKGIERTLEIYDGYRE